VRSMRRTWLVIAVVTLAATGVLSGCASSPSAASQVNEVDAQGFLAAAAQPGVVVVDVRSPQEFAEGHLPGALNISVEAPDFAERIAELDPMTQTLVYCRSGRRSTIAADLMVQSGFTNVVNFSSGGAADLAQAGAVLTTS
jgi:phage shock protein E